jgi:prepilin-type N-terminal cleavage/methylation domain-containing protein
MLRRHHGFTLVELLVVIAIVGILTALLLPAVQAARESGRRTACKNNLRQIGLALHEYHDVHDRLPSGWQGFSNGQADVEGVSGFGWAAAILPYLEQTSLASRIDWRVSIMDSRHDSVRETPLGVFQCPSDLVVIPFWDLDAEDGSGPLAKLPRANYIGVFGTVELESCEGLPLGQRCVGDGILYHNSMITFGQVTDGLSYTLFAGERSSKLGYSTWPGVVAGGEVAFARILGIADHTPNHPTAHFDDFGSMHPQGTNFVLGDASVRSIPLTINIDVYRALATRCGGEPTSIGTP